MASGYGINGGTSRCFPFWQAVVKCYSETDNPGKCTLHKEDYNECLHHSKAVSRLSARRIDVDGFIHASYLQFSPLFNFVVHELIYASIQTTQSKRHSTPATNYPPPNTPTPQKAKQARIKSEFQRIRADGVSEIRRQSEIYKAMGRAGGANVGLIEHTIAKSSIAKHQGYGGQSEGQGVRPEEVGQGVTMAPLGNARDERLRVDWEPPRKE